jgi:predicted MPP superfamily phosphohydrolase
VRFIIIISSLLIYSFIKAVQLWPENSYLAMVLVLPYFLLMIGPLLLSRLEYKIHETAWFQSMVWLSSLLMGLFGTYIIISIPLDIINLCFANTLFSQHFYLSILGLSVVFTLLGLVQALMGPKVKEISCSSLNLPEVMNGLTIAQISDLHVGPTIQKKYVSDVVQKTNSLNPDLIFVTGDLTDGLPDKLIEHLAPLKDLKSRYGIFYVTGNHEYYWGAAALIEKVKTLGFMPLINENKVISIGDKKLLISGVTDPMGNILEGHRPDLKKASLTNEKTDYKILLAHRPDVCLEAEKLGYDLQFSGHTHAGQFFPFSLLIPFFHKYYRGLNRHGRMWVYVNRGTGYWGPANRFANASEITYFKMRRS